MFQIKSFFQKNILRLKGSKNVLKLNFFFHKHFGEKDIGEIGLNFLNKPDKNKIVQDTINRKNYKKSSEFFKKANAIKKRIHKNLFKMQINSIKIFKFF